MVASQHEEAEAGNISKRMMDVGSCIEGFQHSQKSIFRGIFVFF
jgi:hypothetical protein